MGRPDTLNCSKFEHSGVAIHLEILDDKVIFLGRIYSKQDNGDRSFRRMEDFGASFVVLWNPITNCAEIKGLKNYEMTKKDLFENSRELLDRLYDMYGIEVVEWKKTKRKH